MIMLKNVSTHSPTTKSKCGIDFRGITKGGFVDGWMDRHRETYGGIDRVGMRMEKKTLVNNIDLVICNWSTFV